MAVVAILNDTNFKGLVHKGSFMNTPFRVRLATHADYDDVIKIDENVAGGGDYLPSSYHDMMENPKTQCFLAELDGEYITISNCIMEIPYWQAVFYVNNIFAKLTITTVIILFCLFVDNIPNGRIFMILVSV